MSKAYWSNAARKKRYEEIYQLSNDSKLAAKARDYGIKRYREELSELKKQVRTRTTLSTKPRNVKRRMRYAEFREQGLTPTEAREYASSNRKYQQGKAILKYELTNVKEESASRFFSQYYRPTGINNRKAIWGGWVSNRTLPKDVIEWAQTLNRRVGFNDNAGYGYGVMGNYFIYGETIQHWERVLEPDPYVPEKYIYANIQLT